MSEMDALRQVFQTKAVAAAAAAGIPCRIGNENFEPPTDGSVWGHFWYRGGKTTQIELNGAASTECSVGVLQFTLYVAENTGDGAITRAGDVIAKAFNRKQWTVPPTGYVRIEPTATMPIPGVRNGNICVIVEAGYDYYHNDPTLTFD